jgi:predicted nucleotidyltransferase
MSATLTQQLEERVRRELPSLDDAQARELASMLERLVQAFQPERIFVFGSQARDEATSDSDVDVLIVVGHSDEPRFRRGQAAYAIIGPHVTPVDIIVVTREEFDRLLDVPSSLAATVLREGKSLYAA